MDPTGTAVNTPLVMDSETTTRKKRKISETGELVDSWPPKMPLSIDKTDKKSPRATRSNYYTRTTKTHFRTSPSQDILQAKQGPTAKIVWSGNSSISGPQP